MDQELKDYLISMEQRINKRFDSIDANMIDLKETVENSEMMLKALYYDNRDEIRKLKAVK